MKTYINKICSVVLISSMVLSSCTKDFEEINTDPISTPNALPQQLLAPALVSTVAANMSRNRRFNNELMQVTVSQSDGDATIFRYEYRNTEADYLWNSWYPQITNYQDLYRIASDPVTLNTSYQGIALVCQAWVFSLLTDTYGDVPYFEAGKAREGITEPKFDTQKEIYLDIFQKLEEANTLLSKNQAIVASSDPVYNGVVGNWRRFGNSLYLRLLLRISGKAEASADAIAKIKDIVDTRASTYPRISNNDQSAILRWTGQGAYTSPYNSIREQDFRGPSIANYFIDNLRDWNDPRIDISKYGKSSINRWGIAPGQSGFSGVPSGYVPGQGVPKQSYFYSNTSASSLQEDPLTGMIMNYSEVQFILAEAAAKGWINGSAKTFWETGIVSNISLWLPTWPNATATGTPGNATINTPEFRDYLTQADFEWDDTLPLDAPYGTDSKMELIHKAKYYALFLNDMQQWFEHRRTGHPHLPKGQGLRNNGVMPARMTYPVYVQSANPTNYTTAVANQGPDVISTQVWWQKP